ncbi:Uracil permease OS=Streptomyces antimycoticus OX=68175 GN=SANT12839_015990 PE=3 SV=1 [Streptomyces antimycoticus]
MCVVMVVSMTESTADMLALGEIVERPADERTIAAGLRADTLGSALQPPLQRLHVQRLRPEHRPGRDDEDPTGTSSPPAAPSLVLMGLCPMAASLIANCVPPPVLGGAGVVLFGSVAASGIQTLVRAGLEGRTTS